MKNNIITASIIGFILTILLFLPVFVKNLYPFTGDFQVAWFEPWKSDSMVGNSLTVSHKPIADDIFRQLYPFKTFAMNLARNGEIPLWNPYGGAGMPLLATMHVGYLNPFNIVFFFFDNANSWRILILLQPLFISLLTYLYCRKIKISKSGSLFGTIVFIFSGFVVTRSIYADYDYSLIGLLILLNAIEWYMQNKKGLFLIPIGIFLTITSTQIQLFLYIAISTMIYAIFRLYTQDKENFFKKMVNIGIFFLIGIGLSAIQIIPTFELYQYANINTESSLFIIERFLLPMQHFISIVIPNYFGNQATYNYWGSADYIETVCAIGSIPVLFMFYIIRSNTRNALVIFYGLTTLTTILLTLDWFFTRFLFSLPIPILSTGIPSRILFLNTFSFSILGAMGFDQVLRREETIKNFLIKNIPFFILILYIICFSGYAYINKLQCNNSIIINCREIAMRNFIFEFIILFLGFISIIYNLIFKKSFYKNLSSYILIFCVIFGGLYNSSKFLPFTTKRNILPENNILTYIKNKNEVNRFFGIGSASIKTNFGTYYNLFDPNYYDPLYIKRYGELIGYANTGSIKTSRSDVEINNVNITSNQQRLLNLLGTKLFIYKKIELSKEIDKNMQNLFSDKNFTIMQNKKSLPRAYFVQNVKQKRGKVEILNSLFSPDFDVYTSAIVEDDIKIKNHYISGIVSISNYKPNQVTIQSKSNNQEFLVLSDNFFPGWKAFVNNKEVKIYRTNYAFRGIIVPAGNNIINFLYEPLSFKIGALTSGFFLLVYLLALFWPKIRSQKYN